MDPNIIAKGDIESFVPQKMATMVLMAIKKRIILSKMSVMDFSPNIANDGDSVKIPKIGTYRAYEKLTKVKGLQQDVSTDSVIITLDHHAYAKILVEDVARAIASYAFMTASSEALARALVQKYEEDMQNLFDDSAVYRIPYTTTIGDAEIRLARKYLNSKGVQDRVLVACSDDYDALFDIDAFKELTPETREMYREGALGRLRGFDVFEHDSYKAYSMAFSPIAIGVVSRMLPAPSSGQFAIIYDAETGLALRVTQAYSQDYMGEVIQFDMLYGMKLIQPEYAALIVKTASPETNANLSILYPSSGVLAPTFVKTTTAYDVAVPHDIDKLSMIPVVEHPDATIKVDTVTVKSGVASVAKALAVGANSFEVVVTAKDGVTTKTYTITVTRAA